MTHEPIPLTGGKSVHCISEFQMEEAVRMAEQDSASSVKIQKALMKLESELTRNELAALSFVIIRKLKDSA